MPIKKLIVYFVFIGVIFNCKNKPHEIVTSQIIPIPQNQETVEGQFVLNSNTGIEYDKAFNISANFLKSFIEHSSSIILKENNAIALIKDETINNDEGYKLHITPSNIEIHAKTDRGAFYAIQTIRQLLPVAFEDGSFNKEEVSIPCIKIEDEPRFKYRGMHLDVGRHMYSVAFIKKYIDALAMLKMNTFHWHLTEDQGWRIEIKKYPKLQEIAAYRDETLVGHYSDQPHQFDGKKYGGFYTQNEIKDIVAYANTRNITIIPEIEMPGHSQAAIAAYPELGCTGEQVEVAKKWGVFEEVYCTKDETFQFLENVLDEVITLFPSEYIHIGGDEAPKTHWKTCKDCQQRIKEEGLKDEHELQNYFITRIEKYLNSKGRQIIGWDEILEGGLAPNATVMSWRGINGAVEAAKQRHNVVMTPTSHCYFDYYQSENDNEPLAIGGYLPLEKVYNFNPIPEELSTEESKFVLGAQGNIWTEYMPTQEQVEYMAFPRMLAMSEVVWSNPEQKNYSDFVNRVEHFNKRLDALGINYANHLYEVEGKLISDENLSYQLNTLTQGKQIRYTIDGSEPNNKSNVYVKPIKINMSMIIKAAVFNKDEKLGSNFSETINLHKAVGKKISINKEPHKAYSGSGAKGLINGVSGSDSRYGDKEWLGFWGDDIEITIDLGETKEISSIETRFHNGQGQWIYAPKEIKIEFDDETETLHIPDTKDVLVNISLDKNISTRFIKLKIPNYGIIPEGKQGSGNNAWTFIDEIIIN
ncbi:glycoside hydrolase family 20 protein [Hanstruepera flava]|uniref:glycoside hydrolase family 20 protein n=1 Tax=Hanstruepera flava TaxID=2930218 RepID=UPI002028A73B|nr:family 20 glycosylhydrolase [Hanstruepera flava]